MPRITVRKEHIMKGNPYEPERHPVALALCEAFPGVTCAVRAHRIFHYELVVGWYVFQSWIGSSHLMDELEWRPAPHLEALCPLSADVYKNWIWELYGSTKGDRIDYLTFFLPEIGDHRWLIECLGCRRTEVQQYISEDGLCLECAMTEERE